MESGLKGLKKWRGKDLGWLRKDTKIKTVPIGYISLTRSKKGLILKSEGGSALISLRQLKEVLDGKREFTTVRLIVE